MEFKVRWEGQSEDNDLWLDYKELRDNEQLHVYLRKHGMSQLIPDKFNEPKPPKPARKQRTKH